MSDLLEKCAVCGGLIDEEDLFCANCGTAAEHDDDRDSRQDNTSQQTLESHHFQCSACGASMSFDAKAGSLRCPFCGNTSLEEQDRAKELRANRVVPFAVGHSEAIQILRRWLKKGFWRPGDLARLARVKEVAAVYLPYWVFEAKTHTYWTADSSKTPFGARGDWVPLTGEHRASHSDLLIGASGALKPNETSAICPFDMAKARPYGEVDLGNAAIEQFRVKRKYARPLARQGLESLERAACVENYVPGKCRNMKVNVRVENRSSEPVLLPVWIMAYQYKGELFRFLMNGQSGRASGQAPTSWVKIAMVAGLVVLLAIIALVLASSFLQ